MLQNVEGIPRATDSACNFADIHVFMKDVHKLLSYANGKAAGRVGACTWLGPHRYTGASHVIETSRACLLLTLTDRAAPAEPQLFSMLALVSSSASFTPLYSRRAAFQHTASLSRSVVSPRVAEDPVMMPEFLKKLFPDMEKPDFSSFTEGISKMFSGDDEAPAEEPAPAEEAPAEEAPAEE